MASLCDHCISRIVFHAETLSCKATWLLGLLDPSSAHAPHDISSGALTSRSSYRRGTVMCSPASPSARACFVCRPRAATASPNQWGLRNGQHGESGVRPERQCLQSRSLRKLSTSEATATEQMSTARHVFHLPEAVLHSLSQSLRSSAMLSCCRICASVSKQAV